MYDLTLPRGLQKPRYGRFVAHQLLGVRRVQQPELADFFPGSLESRRFARVPAVERRIAHQERRRSVPSVQGAIAEERGYIELRAPRDGHRCLLDEMEAAVRIAQRGERKRVHEFVRDEDEPRT